MSAEIGKPNINGQVLIEKTMRKSPNHRFATVWVVKCPRHGEYNANSCDFHNRKCPFEGGKPGLE